MNELLRDRIAATIHNVEGVECSHVDYRQPSCERDADALLPMVERHASDAAVEALTAFHITTAYDLANNDTVAITSSSDVLNMLARHIQELTARGKK